MTLHEYKHWYTSSEIEMLEDDKKDPSYPFNDYCSHPHLSSHPFFKRALEGYSHFRENNLRILMDMLWAQSEKISLVFIGDSLTTNRIKFIIADIKRYYKNHTEGYDPPLSAEWQSTGLPGNNVKIPLTQMETKQTIQMLEAHLTTHEYDETTGVYHGNAAAIVDYANHKEKRNALIMVTMGAWFNEEDKFLDQMSPVVKWLQSVAQRKYVKNKVVWFAAMPQHFQTPNGYFEGILPVENQKTNELQCRPIANDDLSRDWRHNILQNYLHNISDQYIEIFDDRDIYKPMYNHHSTNIDCTHFCYHPVVLQPMYEKMIKWLKL